MGFLDLRKLYGLWKLKEVTVEHLQGQILQWAIKADEQVIALDARSQRTNRRLDAIEKEIGIKK